MAQDVIKYGGTTINFDLTNINITPFAISLEEVDIISNPSAPANTPSTILISTGYRRTRMSIQGEVANKTSMGAITAAYQGSIQIQLELYNNDELINDLAGKWLISNVSYECKPATQTRYFEMEVIKYSES